MALTLLVSVASRTGEIVRRTLVALAAGVFSYWNRFASVNEGLCYATT